MRRSRKDENVLLASSLTVADREPSVTIPRPRLVTRLLRAARFPLSLLIAPAGFGKTVAIEQYVQAAQQHVVRFEVTEAERSLAGFLRGLAHALADVAPAATRSCAAAYLRALESNAPVGTLAAWLEAHLQGVATTIAIENLHEAHDPRVTEFLQAFVERVPPQIRLIVSSREALNVPLPSWLAREITALPLDADELRFTYEEALESTLDGHSDVPASRLRTIMEATAGWPAAFVRALRHPHELAALRAGDAPSRAAALHELARARFSAEDAMVQDFMLRTSCFATFDVELLHAAGWTQARDVLVHLGRKGDVLVERQGTFRYTAPLRAYLRGVLVAERTQADVLRSGAESLERAGRDAEALRLWIEANAPAALRRNLTRSGFAALDAGYADDVSEALGVASTDAQPWPAALALGAVTGNVPAPRAARRAVFADALASIRSDAARAQLAHRFAVELARRGDYNIIEMLEPFVQMDEVPPPLRASVGALLASAYLASGARELAQKTMRAALLLVQEAGRGKAYARIMYHAADVASDDPPAAAEYAQLSIDAALAYGDFELAAGGYRLLYALVDDATDTRATAMLVQIAHCGLLAANARMRLRALASIYESEIRRGRLERLDELDRELAGSAFDEAEAARMSAAATRAAWRSDFSRAYAILAGASTRGRDAEQLALREAELALYAAAASMSVESASAIAAAREALRATQSSGSRRVLQAKAYLALATLMLGRVRNAEALLADLERVRDGRALPGPLLRALRAVFERWRGLAQPGEMQAAFDNLRELNFGGTARLLEAIPLPGMVRAEVGRLTAAESDILVRIAAGLTSKAIAAESGRSVQTVNVHVKSICRKLNCSGRREALSVALGQGLIAQVAPGALGRLTQPKRGKRPGTKRRA